MKKSLFLGILISSFLIRSQSFAQTESDNSDNKESEKPYSNSEIILDITKGVCASAGAGVSAACGNVPVAVGEIIYGVEKFLEAADKYCENCEFEADRDNDNDNWHHGEQDSWDHDY